MSCLPDGVCSDSSFSTVRSWDLPTIALTIFLGGVVVIFGTRMKTSLDFSTIEGDKVRRPPVLPYSIPYIGHLFSVLWSPDDTVEADKRISPANIFALKIVGQRHNVIGSPTLINKVYGERENFTKDPLLLKHRILKKVFAMSSRDTPLYMSILKQSLFASQSQHQDILQRLTKQLQSTLPDLLTFNPQPIDQEPWERGGRPSLSDDNNTSTIDLLPLLHIFLTHITTNAILTPSLLGQQPDVAPLLLQLTYSFVPLFTGTSRTIPHPSLPKAHIARLQLLQQLAPFCAALRSATAGADPGPEWRDLLEDPDSVSPLLASMQQRWADGNLSLDVRTSAMAMALWQLNNTHGLAFWMLLHILSGPGIADTVREEMEPYVHATQPEKFMGFAQPVRVKLNTEGLMMKCPTLVSCYLETVRLYGREWWCGKLATDYLINEENGLVWNLKAGEWVDVSFWLGNKDEGLFHPDPEAWRWERHVDYVKAVMGGDMDVEDQVFRNCKTILYLFSMVINKPQ